MALLFKPSRLLAWVTCLAVILPWAHWAARAQYKYIFRFQPARHRPCATALLQSRWQYGAAACLLAAGSLVNAAQLKGELAESEALLRLARPGKFVSRESTVVWGASLPFQYVFPVFTREADLRDTRIYGLGVFTLAPFSVPTADERAGKGLLARLQSEAGIELIAVEQDQSLLNIYCIEHYGTPLRLTVAKKTEMWTVMNANCAHTGSR